MALPLKLGVVGVAAIISTAAVAPVAQAADAAQDVPVGSRTVPGYEPIPMHVGSFLVSPSITGVAVYEDNYLALETNKKSANYYVIQPDVTFQSTWSRNTLSGHAYVSKNFYSNSSTEEATTGGARADLNLLVDNSASLGFGGSVDHFSLPRTATNAFYSLRNPEEYTVAAGYGQVNKDIGRIRLSLRGDYTDISYDNDSTVSGLTVYLRDQNHAVASGTGTVAYSFRPDVSIYSKLLVNNIKYRDALPGEFLRDSSGYDITFGANLNLTHLIKGDFSLGYLEQSYDNALFRTVSGLSVHANLLYLVTPLTNLTLSVDRSVENSGIINVSGYLLTTVKVGVLHELRRNLVVNASAKYDQVDFGSYGRNDDRWSLTLGTNYLISRSLSFNLNINALNQNSTGLHKVRNFDDNSVSAGLTYHFW